VTVTAIASASNDSVASNNRANDIVGIIDAIDDSASTPFGIASSINVLTNDRLGSVAATTGNVTISVVTGPPAGATFDVATGQFSVPAGAAPGVYPVTYRICVNPCDTATATLTVGPSPDVTTTVRVANSSPTPSVSTTVLVDFGNVGAAVANNVVVTLQMPTGLSGVSPSNGGIYNATTGLVTWPTIPSIAASTPLAGTYSVDYVFPANGSVAFTSNATVAGGEASTANNPSTVNLSARPVNVPTLGSGAMWLLLLLVFGIARRALKARMR
jgi:hypothetical protein